MIFRNQQEACPDIRGRKVHDHYLSGPRSMGVNVFQKTLWRRCEILPGICSYPCGWKRRCHRYHDCLRG